jgi:hypothetical protein
MKFFLKTLRSTEELKEAMMLAHKEVTGKGLQKSFPVVVQLLSEMCDIRQELL